MKSLDALVTDLARHAKPKADRLPRDEAELWSRLGFSPRPIQMETLTSKHRFRVEVWHRRAGKTVAMITTLVARALACPFPRPRYYYAAPTYQQVTDIAWPYVSRIAERIPGAELQTSTRTLLLPTLSGDVASVRLIGVDNPKQRIRGAYLDGVVLDEFQDLPEHVWTEQVRATLSDENRRGEDLWGYPNQWARIIGTPKGRNQLYQYFSRAQRWQQGKAVYMTPEGDPEARVKPIFRRDWGCSLWPASQTGILPQEELEAALADIGPERYAQEYECSFDAMIEGAVFKRELAHLRKAGRITELPELGHLGVVTGWDLGYDDHTAIWFAVSIGGIPHLIDYYEVSGAGLPQIVAELARRGYVYEAHLLPHDVAVHELGTGKSRRAILEELGVRVTVVPRHDPVGDGIPAARRFLAGCYVDALKCADGLDRLALYRREKDANGTFRAKPVHDGSSHAADALRILAMGWRRTFGVDSDHVRRSYHSAYAEV